jgi:hypothetical protein
MPTDLDGGKNASGSVFPDSPRRELQKRRGLLDRENIRRDHALSLRPLVVWRSSWSIVGVSEVEAFQP